MCFSATASLAAGGTLSAAGGFTLAQTKTKAALPFAAIPLLFGIQQSIEGVVWLSLGSSLLNEVATYAYSMFSHVLWPILVPVAVLLLEHDPVRKRILRVFAAIGLAVGLYLFYFIVADGVTPEIRNSSILYRSPHLYLPLVLTLYVTATCVSSLFSSLSLVRLLGAVMLVSFAVAGFAFRETFISVWCFFAAILSVIVFWQIRTQFAVGAQAETRSGVG